MKLIVGLGNPGKEYERTRHNIGFEAVNALVHKYGGAFSKWKNDSELCEIGVERICVLKPLSFMNRSGFPVREFAHFYKIEPQDILVIHDELDIPCGDLRLKYSGGEAGHNGLRSISEQLGTRNYWRLRFGVGKAPVNEGHSGGAVSWVLGRFSQEENSAIIPALERCKKIVSFAIEHGLKKAQTSIGTL